MWFKAAYVCVLVFFVQKISGQCIGHTYNSNYGNNFIAAESAALPGITHNAYASGLGGLPESSPFISNGAGFIVKSSSAISPSGVIVQSDNLQIDGPLTVSGQVPFLGVVALEGPLAAAGSGSVAYGCGNGNVGIASEGLQGLTPDTNCIGVGVGLSGLGYNGLPIY